MMQPKRLAVVSLALVASLYFVVAALFYIFQDRLLYDPDANRTLPQAAGLPMVEEVALVSGDGTRLLAWYTPPTSGQPVILFLHGKGGALKDRPTRYRYYVSQGFGVLFLSYRGYGGSGGQPSEAGFADDAVAAYRWLIAKGIAADQIVLVGESLGTGIAIQLAAREKVSAIALEAPYTSVADVANQRYWWLPVNLLIKDRFDSLSIISKVHVPLLIHHGELDRSVPVAYGRALFARANEPKEFIELNGKTHFIYTEDVFAREVAFFRNALKFR
jgi:uncharacterized protein